MRYAYYCNQPPEQSVIWLVGNNQRVRKKSQGNFKNIFLNSIIKFKNGKLGKVKKKNKSLLGTQIGNLLTFIKPSHKKCKASTIFYGKMLEIIFQRK